MLVSVSTAGTAVVPAAPGGGSGPASGTGIPAILAHLFFVFWTSGLSVLIVLGTNLLSGALRTCRDEKDRLRDEREAFAGYIDRISDLEPVTVEVAKAPVSGEVQARTSGGTRPANQELKRAYRQTVMDVPHFQREYGESLEEHMRAELGPEVTEAIVQEQPWTEHLKRALIHKSELALAGREEVLGQLEHELRSLGESHDRLGTIEGRLRTLNQRPLPEQGFDELRTVYERLRTLETRDRTLLNDRQNEILERSPSGHDFNTYLYDGLEVDYPVLVAGVDVLSLVRTAKTNVRRALTARV